MIGYAVIAPASVRILQLNAARLCLYLGDLESARSYVSIATNVKDAVISNRLKLDPRLASLMKQTPS
jgi:hypothetical protein